MTILNDTNIMKLLVLSHWSLGVPKMLPLPYTWGQKCPKF